MEDKGGYLLRLFCPPITKRGKVVNRTAELPDFHRMIRMVPNLLQQCVI
jgi:hypothetical protein